MAPGPPIDAARVIADLGELDRRTGGPEGAHRVAWTEGWREARRHLDELLAEIGVGSHRDAAGNLWAKLPGASDEPALAVGSHLDSVPAGGRLDGALGVMAAVGVLRAWAEADEPPPRPIALVDWADEEGARFGRSLLGSSAFSGTLDVDAVRDLRDAEGVRLEDALRENEVEVDRMLEARGAQAWVGSYLELHIEQGPVLEAAGQSCAAVGGCVGIERGRYVIEGQAAHAGTTPMGMRRDAGLAAAEAALRIERIGERSGGVATTGRTVWSPGVATAVAGSAELLVDLRHADAGALKRMLEDVAGAIDGAARDRDCAVATRERIWSIEPLHFDRDLLGIVRSAVEERSGEPTTLTSGALHDAAEVSRVVPAAMVFTSSRRGLSHTALEDTSEEDLVAGIEVLGEAVAGTLSGP